MTQIIYDMPEKEYHAHHALGSTSIRLLSDPYLSLADVKYQMDNSEQKEAYDVGTLAHALILEGSLDHLIKFVPHKDYRTKAAKAAKDDALNEGLIPINESEEYSKLGAVYRMRDEVMKHPIAAELFTGHQSEVSIFWEQEGVPMKARVDAIKPGIWADLKTMVSPAPDEVKKQISNYGYYIQKEHYLTGGQAATGFRPDWYFVAAGKSEPHSVSVHTVNEPEAIEAAQARIDYAIRRYKYAQEYGWTGYTAIYDHGLTPWEARKADELLEMTE